MKHLSVYYFKGQDFCMRPAHIQDDMKRLRDAAVDSIFIGIHEGDLRGSNLPLVCAEAEKEGLNVWGIPSRIGGLIAGWHRAVGYLSANRHDLCARNEDGSLVQCFGPQISVHHPEAVGAFSDAVIPMIKELPLEGIVWDEVKCLETVDYSEHAVAETGKPPTPERQKEKTVELFSKVNGNIKNEFPDLKIALFLYCFMNEDNIKVWSNVSGLDEFGCDGGCLRPEDAETGEGGKKKILLPDNFKRFRDAAAENSLRNFVLIETQMQSRAAVLDTIKRIPEFLQLGPEHLVYYDYPRLMEDAEELQPRIAELFMKWRC